MMLESDKLEQIRLLVNAGQRLNNNDALRLLSHIDYLDYQMNYLDQVVCSYQDINTYIDIVQNRINQLTHDAIAKFNNLGVTE